MTTPIMGDGLPAPLLEMLGDGYQVFSWDESEGSEALATCVGVITYGHPTVDGSLMDRMPNLKVISNHGVGVDHIVVADAHKRGLPVGNTPGCLDAATADMTMALLMASARNVVIGDHFARGPRVHSLRPFDPDRARSYRQHAGHRRHGANREAGGETGSRVRHEDSLSQPAS